MKTTKKIGMILVAAAFLLTILREGVYSEERKVNFKVDGVTCLSIAYTVESIPILLDGVQSSKYDFTVDSVTVVFDDAKVSVEEIKKTFENENFPVVEEPLVIK